MPFNMTRLGALVMTLLLCVTSLASTVSADENDDFCGPPGAEDVCVPSPSRIVAETEEAVLNLTESTKEKVLIIIDWADKKVWAVHDYAWETAETLLCDVYEATGPYEAWARDGVTWADGEVAALVGTSPGDVEDLVPGTPSEVEEALCDTEAFMGGAHGAVLGFVLDTGEAVITLILATYDDLEGEVEFLLAWVRDVLDDAEDEIDGAVDEIDEWVDAVLEFAGNEADRALGEVERAREEAEAEAEGLVELVLDTVPDPDEIDVREILEAIVNFVRDLVPVDEIPDPSDFSPCGNEPLVQCIERILQEVDPGIGICCD